ncbi:Phthiotriol/phenolphthiotriol dimycocerosates methyltransferase [compost metagenome]
MSVTDEQKRLTEVYGDRARRLPADFYSAFHPGNLFILQGRERGLLRMLSRAGLHDLSECQILDLGCGTGSDLRRLLDLGARPEHLHGVDLLSERLEHARMLAPQLHFELADAQHLPFADATFDLVMQGTAFSSIVDPEIRRRVADEVLRVLKPGGVLLWYDMRLTDPRNSDLVPMTARELARLFPTCERHLEAVTLLPPLARRLAPMAWGLCVLLEAFPFLRSHYVGFFRKRD